MHNLNFLLHSIIQTINLANIFGILVFDQIYGVCFSSYYIRQAASQRMKCKKKSSVSTKKTSKKTNVSKPVMLIDKTVATTKQKTHNTIQDPVQIKDTGNIRSLIHSARNNPTRLSYIEKLEQCNLSPFSSPGKCSLSPKQRKTISPLLKEEKDKKKNKSKPLITNDKGGEKKKFQCQKLLGKSKQKMTGEECNFQYQNLLLKKLNEKKITELSDQSSGSITKINKLNLNIRLPKQQKQFSLTKSKIEKVRELKLKISQKYKRDLPFLSNSELKFFCSIVLIQRLWKHRKIKHFISEFISPRSNPQCNITSDSHRQNISKLDTTRGTLQEQTSQLIKKYHHFSLSSQRKIISLEREAHSTEVQTAQKKMNLKQLELSVQFSPDKQKKIIKFVQCLRDIKFCPPSKKHEKSKINVFNLQQSLSQKCLMQSLYEKVFKNSPSKLNNFEMFNLKKDQKNLERSIQLIKNMKSPQKPVIIQTQERFETEMQAEDAVIVQVPQIQTVQISVETDHQQQLQDNKQIKSLKDLSKLSQQLINLLLSEFCQQFHSFTGRSVLRQRKKNRMPGLKVTKNSIRQYLNGLTLYMTDNYQSQVVRRFNLISPISFLKIHHQYDQEEDYIEDQDDEINMPIIPNTLFYQYQMIYESQKFVIKEEDQKFSNFLQSLIKIHNLLLSRCFSEMIQKTRIDRIILPWDNKFDANRHKKVKFSTKNLDIELTKIINSICDNAFMRVGQFHKSLDDSAQQQKLLKSIRIEFQSQGNQWSAQYQNLQLRMDITKSIQEAILEEAIKDLMIFF